MPTRQKSTRSKSKNFSRGAISLPKLLIFVLAFANIGVLAQLFTSATTSTNKVHFIFFCATDKCSGSTTTLNTYATQVRSWYSGKVGRTFSLDTTSKHTGAHTAGWYGTHSVTYGTNADTRTYYNILNELNPPSNVQYVIMLGFHSMTDCGIGGGNLSVIDPYAGCSGAQNDVYAHELGHSFGLVHTGTNSMKSCASNSTLRDHTLMDCYYACNGVTLTSCALNRTQATKLYSNAWFTP